MFQINESLINSMPLKSITNIAMCLEFGSKCLRYLREQKDLILEVLAEILKLLIKVSILRFIDNIKSFY